MLFDNTGGKTGITTADGPASADYDRKINDSTSLLRRELLDDDCYFASVATPRPPSTRGWTSTTPTARTSPSTPGRW